MSVFPLLCSVTADSCNNPLNCTTHMSACKFTFTVIIVVKKTHNKRAVDYYVVNYVLLCIAYSSQSVHQTTTASGPPDISQQTKREGEHIERMMHGFL